MSFSVEVELTGTCDGCGGTLGESDPVFCASCALPEDFDIEFLPKCQPFYRPGGLLVCGTKYEPWRWQGDLSPFCPCCGHPIQR